MLNKITLLAFLLLTYWTQAQERCGFDVLHRQQLQENQDYVKSIEAFEQNLIANYHSFKLKANGSSKIPLVIHVMDANNSLTQITDEQIYAAIQNLNETYRKVAGTHGDGKGVDVTIEFALAIRDPQGKCTNGITRRDMTTNTKYMAAGTTSNADGISDATLKTLDVWDQTKYYNIWLVSEIDNNNGAFGTQGYAYFASSHGFANDGTVILVNAFKNENDHTLPHELGHALNLYHTFEGDADGKSCPANTNCSTNGDKICDTPPHIRSKSDCVVGTNSCDGGSSTENFIRNYMDYSSNSCANMFTSGQKVRMLAALNSTRASFLEENGNLSLIPVSTPTVDFIASSEFVCTGSTVNFNSRTSCVPNSQISSTVWTNISFKWTLKSGATELTSTLENPNFQLNTSGTYDVTLDVTSSFGTQTLTKPAFIVVSSAPKAACTPKSINAGNYWNCVTNVTLNTINNTTSLYDNVAYTDFSCSNSTILEVGKSYDLTVSIRAADNSEIFEAYIDYNNNGIFENSEKIHEGSTPADTVKTPIVPFKKTVTIPQSAVVNTPLRMRIYGEANILSTADKNCTGNMYIGDVEDYAVYIKSTCVAPSITSQPTTPIATCSGSGTQTLTVTATGDNLIYQWRKGGVNISNNAIYSGVTSNTLTLTNATSNETGSYDVVVTGACSPTAVSNAVTVSVTPSVTPSVTITSTDVDNTFCPGTSVVYTANLSNGGLSPTYQWKNKGVAIKNEMGNTFTTTSLVNNDQISVEISSNATCKTTANVTSNALTVSVSSFTPSVTITSTDIDYSICSGSPVTFTATPVNAGNATYQWKLNGNTISIEKATTYTTTTLLDNDYVEAILTSLEACALPTSANSNQITMKVNSLPSASISSGATTCITDPATILNLTGSNGLAPYEFTYTVNGNTPTKLSSNVGTINTGTDNAGMYNYEITKVTDANGCSKNITGQTAMILLKPLGAPVVSCDTITPTSITFNWYALNGATNYQIAYSVNSGLTIDAGSTSDLSFSIDSLKTQNSVEISVTPIGTGCFKSATQFCTTSLNSLTDLDNFHVSIFPNPTTGKVTFNAIPSGYTQLQLTDNSGRIVSEKGINNVDMIYDFSDISKGNYLITFLGENNVAFSKKLIIQ
jgi:hypothetical protein